MREFFCKTSPQSIWPFVNFFRLKITTDKLYEAFFIESFDDEKSWSLRCKLHVKAACIWFWKQICDSYIEYDKFVWHTKMKNDMHLDHEQLFHKIYAQLYE